MYLKSEYINSCLSSKLSKLLNIKLAFLDIDNTLTGKPREVNNTRKNLEEKGFGFILVTARTEEMLMSKNQFLKSVKLGFKRPIAKLQKKEPKGILDPDIIIGSSGCAIYIKQQSGGYLEDKKYQKKIIKFKNWRKNTLNLLKKIDPLGLKYCLPEIEDPKNYYDGSANVLTPEFRIQINFKTLKDKEYIYKSLQKVEKENNLNLSDDSDPRISKFSIYLTPYGVTKGKACNHVVETLCSTFKIDKKNMEILFAGDALADLDMGYLEKDGADTTLLIVGGSRLSEGQIKEFTKTIPGFPPRQLIIGDKTYPGTRGPQTILAFINQSL